MSDDAVTVTSADIVEAATELVIPAVALPPTRNPMLVYLSRLGGETSATSMRSAIRCIAATLRVPEGTPPELIPWHALRYPDVRGMIALWRSEKLAPRTINQRLAALRGIISEAENLRMIATDDARLILKIKGERIDRSDLAGRALTDDEVRRLVGGCDLQRDAGLRDLALLALLFGGGLRRREASRVKLSDVDHAAGVVRVLGKGAKTRMVPLSEDAWAMLRAWLARGIVRAKTDPVLVAFDLQREIKRSDAGTLRHLTVPGVYSVLCALAKRVGVDEVSPHDARRTRITRMLLAGESVALVQRLAGHESIETTGRYVRAEDEAVRAAATRVPMVPSVTKPTT